MASTYVNDLRLNEMATGDQSGSWGTVTNLNLELIGEAFSYGTEAITTNADTHTTTIADGAADAGRSMFLKYTGTLDSACTITIGPNTVSKVWFIENSTSGSQNIIISQGSGANVTIAAGQTKAVYSDGAGTGAAFVDAFAALDVGSLAIAGTLVTSTAAELNILDGVTATAAELNILDGVTATTAELNILDGVTATAAEINYVDGVTSNIQTQLGTKMPLAGGTFTGAVNFTVDSNFTDGDKLTFGSSNDLQIYHDGSHSRILDNGTGDLYLQGNNLYLTNASGNNFFRGISGGEVNLYHNNSAKLATNSGGITVTGTINGGDLRGDVWTIGRDSNDYFSVGTTTHKWYLDGTEDMRLENDGDLHVEGNVIAYSTTISDERLKTDIVKIDGALDKVAQLNGYTFTYTADGKKSAGVIAQEVQKVLPSAIIESKLPLKMGDDDQTEYMTVQYDQLMGLMIEAIKELKAEVAELKGK